MPAKLRLHAASATFFSLAVILAIAVVGLVALSGAEAANQPKCGDTITVDTTLHKDLVNCPNNGIVIGADDITLDLNGHLIDGDGTVASGCNPNAEICDSGIVDDGHDGVTVKRGRVREFGIGVLFGTTTPGRVRHARVLGISSSRNLFFGFVIASSTRSQVRNSSGNRNIAPEGDGIGLFDSNHVRILHNSFRHNPGPGIHVAGSTENLIKRNVFSRNSPGILFGGDLPRLRADSNRVRGNKMVRNRGSGILLGTGSRNLIARNRIFEGGEGIGLEKGYANLVARNVIVGPHQAGVRLALYEPPIGGRRNLVRLNIVRDSGDDAFLVRPKDRHSHLTRNVAIGAGDDGFDVRSRTTKLTGNRATSKRRPRHRGCTWRDRRWRE